MRIVAISDTHCYTPEIEPGGDVLVHAGDLCASGSRSETVKAIHWLYEQSKKFRHTVLIAGNHDRTFVRNPELVKSLMEVTGIHYLEDSGVTLDGVNFWGSPYQPRFMNWAFNCDRGEEIRRHWELIPENTDVLVTHGPPYGILDQCFTDKSEHLGCNDLLAAVLRVKPKYHIFGHIHGGAGVGLGDPTVFVNASAVNEAYQVAHPPTVLDL